MENNMETEIARRFYVTPEQMNKVTRLIDGDGNTFYQAESQSEVGRLYEVRYNIEHKRFSCTCKAGMEGFGCWHRRAALACAYEYRMQQNRKAQAQSILEAAYQRHLGNYWVTRQSVDKVRQEIRDGVEYPDFWKDR